MRAPAISPASRLGRLALSLVALLLATTLAGAAAAADEPAFDAAPGAVAELDATAASGPDAASADGAAPAGEPADGGVGAASFGTSGDAGDAAQGALLAGQLSMELPLEAVAGGDGAAAQAEPSPPQTLSGYLASGKLRVSADVALAADGAEPEPVVGSFAVDGLAYAVTGEGEAALVAVGSGTLASSLAGAPSGEDSGSGVPTSPLPSPEGAASDESGLKALSIQESVEHGGVAYAVASVGPRALAGCDAATVTLPATVASVDGSAFSGSAVAAVEVAAGNSSYSSYDGMLFDADRTRLLLVPEGKQGAARIPKEAEVVDPSCFSHSAGVDSIDVEAGSAAFSSRNGCLYDASGETLLRVPAGATDIQIADGCTTVAAGSMEGCAHLTAICAPSSVAAVDPDAGSSMTGVVVAVAGGSSPSCWEKAGYSVVDGGSEDGLVPDAPTARTDAGSRAAASPITVTIDPAGGTATMMSASQTVNASGVASTTGAYQKYATYEDTFNVSLNGVSTYGLIYSCYWDDYPRYQINWTYNPAGATVPRTQYKYVGSFWKAGAKLSKITLRTQAGSTSTFTYPHSAGVTMDKETPITTSCNLTLVWEDYDYDILFRDSDGSTGLPLVEDTTYQINTGKITLPTTYKMGHKFEGWEFKYASNVVETNRTWRDECPYGPGIAWEEDATGARRQVIQNGTCAHILATAKWTENTFSVDANGGWLKVHRTWIPKQGQPDTTGNKNGWWNAQTRAWQDTEPTQKSQLATAWTATKIDDRCVFYRANYKAAEYNIYGTQGRWLYRIYPTRDGYEPGKWSLDGKPVEPVNADGYTGFTSNTNPVKATYNPTEYTITYVLGSGTVKYENPATYTIEDNDIMLNNPSCPGWDFTGWTAVGASGTGVENGKWADGSPKTTIKKGTYGNLTLTAGWYRRQCTFDASPGTIEVTRYRQGPNGEDLGTDYLGGGSQWMPHRYADNVMMMGPTKYWVSYWADHKDDGSRSLNYINAVRTGYKVTGWNDNGEPATTTWTYLENDACSLITDHTYTPQWSPISYTVTWKTSWDGGAYGSDIIDYDKDGDDGTGHRGQLIPKTEYIAEHEGEPWYKLLGWSRDPNDHEADYAFGAKKPNLTTTDGDQITLYVAKEKNAAVFDPNGGTLYQHAPGSLHGQGWSSSASPLEVTWTVEAVEQGPNSDEADEADRAASKSFGDEARVTFDYDGDLRCMDVVRPGYVFQGWTVTDRDGNEVGRADWADGPIVRGATYKARWVPALRVDVPLAIDFDLEVDWGASVVKATATGSNGAEQAFGDFSSQSAESVRITAVGQDALSAEDMRSTALAALAEGDEAKAGNLESIKLTLAADDDATRRVSFSLAELYRGRADAHPGSVTSLHDLSSLDLVVPAASSNGSPGTLRVRYGMDCAGLPLEDVDIDGRSRSILKLVYVVELVGS